MKAAGITGGFLIDITVNQSTNQLTFAINE